MVFVEMRKYLFCLLAIQFGVSCNRPNLPETVLAEYEKLPEYIDFNKDIKPILSDKCFICHGPDKAKIKAGLQLHSPETAFNELKESPGKYALTPGNLNESEVFHRIVSMDPNYVMPEPDSHLSLSEYEKAALIKWIEQGAEYKDHWAFIKPEEHEVPKIHDENLASNPIDNFVISRLDKEGLKPTPVEGKEVILRRLSLDLTGLPPTLEELDNFLNDSSAQAYEKQVDRLLSSQHYGEQMALDWMDLSRFADTHGYSVDRYRDMSPWRDWVIKSFNENMSYDQFLTWQLAGDLMENPSREMILATAFNRIHPQNMEGGIINEEFLVEYAIDRTSTAGQAFMGLTVACARCHDHKYDPISHKEFYEMTSYFNNVNESGQISYNDAMPVPTLMLTTKEQDDLFLYMKGLITQTENDIEKVESTEVAHDFEEWFKHAKYKEGLKRNVSNELVAYYNLEDKRLTNNLDQEKKGTVKVETAENLPVNLVDGKHGKGLLFDGDAWLDLKGVGVFGRNDAFSISVWANIPADIKDGNIFHKGIGSIFNNWRGYHLKVVENRLEIMMAHTAPDNAIIKLSKNEFPRDQWVHFTMTYDGSSKAHGFKLYMNGKEVETILKNDNLYKDILFNIEREPGLQLGARYRGKGIKGAVLDEIKVFERELSAIDVMILAENSSIDSIASKAPKDISAKEKDMLKLYFTHSVSKKAKNSYAKLAALRKKYVDSIEKVQEVMVMKETPEPVQSYILDRGVYSEKREKVYPNTPTSILPMPKEYPKNRLGLAKWLMHDDHPLTARVAVNRFWQHYFGIGLVKTSEDFGNQGEMPSHPELLDWLALYFKDSGWDVKGLQKLIVMSNTYRQSSLTNENLMAKDIENRLLARGPSKRLTGEMLRDNVLASSGLLNRTIGGESVSPYQPEGLWLVNGARYQVDSGNKLYRRSIYTIWKRSVPHPTLATFDSPARDYCTIRRQETNTPLQALVLLNDPTYIEAARVLGKEIVSYPNVEKGISTVFRKLTGRTIKSTELQLLLELQKEEYLKFIKNGDKTKGWLNTGEFKLSKEDDGSKIAANAVVVSTIINMDAFITKR